MIPKIGVSAPDRVPFPVVNTSGVTQVTTTRTNVIDFTMLLIVKYAQLK